jgi:hypothetical protein
MKRPSGNQIAIILTLVCTAVFYQFICKPFNRALKTIATGADAERCGRLGRYITNQFAFEKIISSNPDGRPFYTSPSRNAARFVVYGITNSERQDELLTALKDWQTTNQDMAKLTVRFYERENWRAFTNEQRGYSGGERLPEVVLREITLLARTNHQAVQYK